MRSELKVSQSFPLISGQSKTICKFIRSTHSYIHFRIRENKLYIHDINFVTCRVEDTLKITIVQLHDSTIQ